MKIITKLLHILFPVTCIVCSTGTIDLCQKCKENFYRSERDIPDWITAVWSYKSIGIHDIIVHIKKFPNVRLLSFLVSDIYSYLIYDLKQKNIILHKPIIIPVPITKNRYYERGYNQAEIIARTLWKQCHHANLQTDTCIKNHDNKKQATLDKKLRMINTIGLFSVIKPKQVQGRDILIVDDVTTTTATLGALRTVLLEAGARTVHAVTIAH